MRFILDANGLSALMKGDANAVARLRATEKGDVGVPQPVLAEIAYGIERLPRSARRSALEGRYRILRDELPRVSWSDEVSEHFGRLKALLERKGQRIEDFDLAIAAHAVACRAVLVSADVGDMARIPGLRIVDWRRPA